MTARNTDDSPDGAPTKREQLGRRRLLSVTAVAAAGLAGCSDVLGNGGDDGSQPDNQEGSTPQNDDDTATDEEASGDDAGSDTSDDEDREADYRIHDHGTLTVEIDGEPVDFGQDTYTFPDRHPDPELPPFHFHADGDAEKWHMESEERLVFGRCLNEIPETSYEQHPSGHILEIEGETYDEEEQGVSIEITANGDSVDPLEYEVQDGDDLRVVVETDG